MNSNKAYLYTITNVVNSKKYVGITKYPKRRWGEHKSPSSTCTKIRNAIQKYGESCFIFEILVCGNEDYIIELEKKAIDLFDSINDGYNLIYGDPKSRLTTHPETIEKQRQGLLKHYKNNKSKNIGKISTRREAVYCKGFIFPSIKLAKEILNIKSETLSKYLKTGIACKLNNKEQIILVEKQELLSYLKFKRLQCREKIFEILLKLRKKHRYRKVSEHHLKNPPTKGKKGSQSVRSKPIIINGVGYCSISTAVRLTGMSKSMIERRIKNKIKGFEFFDMKNNKNLVLLDG